MQRVDSCSYRLSRNTAHTVTALATKLTNNVFGFSQFLLLVLLTAISNESCPL